MAPRAPPPDEGPASSATGRIRLEGHFCGTVTSAAHRIEVAVPIAHEVPYAALEPLLRALHRGDGAEVGGAGTKLWADMMALFDADAPEAAQPPCQALPRTALTKTLSSFLGTDLRGDVQPMCQATPHATQNSSSLQACQAPARQRPSAWARLGGLLTGLCGERATPASQSAQLPAVQGAAECTLQAPARDKASPLSPLNRLSPRTPPRQPPDDAKPEIGGPHQPGRKPQLTSAMLRENIKELEKYANELKHL